jgi:CDP-diacylglycerol--glycerol-3-phosphate 3-phosphatidyltransferase
MPSVYDLKPRFQQLLRPLIASLARAGFTANAMTLIALAGSIMAGVGIAFAGRYRALLLLLPFWLFARMALNAIDGMMARELGMSSQLGAVLNESGDAASDLALYLPLAIVSPASQWPVVSFAIGAVLTEFCGVLGRALGASRRYEGPMGKSDRAFVVGALALITFLFPSIEGIWPWVFGACAALTLLTCFNRLSKALTELKQSTGEPETR